MKSNRTYQSKVTHLYLRCVCVGCGVVFIWALETSAVSSRSVEVIHALYLWQFDAGLAPSTMKDYSLFCLCYS